MRLLLTLAAALLLAGCDEQDVQYETKAAEPIPAVPAQPAAMSGAPGPMRGAPAMNAGGSVALPEVQQAEFSAQKPEGEFAEATYVGLKFPVPASYDERAGSGMRAAEWRIPAPGEGAEGAEMIAYYFGMGQGGGAEENVQRWAGQFQPSEEGGSPLGLYQQAKHDGLTVTRVFLEGTWTPPRMGMAAATEPKKDFAMDALIIEGGSQGSLFLRMTGPRALVLEQGPAMEYLASQVKPVNPE